MAVEVLVGGSNGKKAERIRLFDAASIEDGKVKITLPNNVTFKDVTAIGGVITVLGKKNQEENIKQEIYIHSYFGKTSGSILLTALDGSNIYVGETSFYADFTSNTALIPRLGGLTATSISSASGNIGY